MLVGSPDTLSKFPYISLGTWKGMALAMQTIHAENGVRGLFQGHSATLLRIFPYAGIKFMVYDKLHNARQFLYPFFCKLSDPAY